MCLTRRSLWNGKCIAFMITLHHSDHMQATGPDFSPQHYSWAVETVLCVHVCLCVRMCVVCVTCVACVYACVCAYMMTPVCMHACGEC